MKISNNTIKYIAVIAMTIDHIAFMFVPADTALYFFMRLIGRLTAPLMSFCIAEGFHHTRNRLKYLARVITFAVASQPLYFMMIFGRLPLNAVEFLTHWNVLYNFAVSLVILLIFENVKPKNSLKPLKFLLIAILLIFSTFGDWGLFITAWVGIFHLCRNHAFWEKAMLFGVVSIFLTALLSPYFFSFGVLLSLIPLSMYSGMRDNGKTGGNKEHGKYRTAVNKWGFYLYYPLHTLVLILIKIYLKI